MHKSFNQFKKKKTEERFVRIKPQFAKSSNNNNNNNNNKNKNSDNSWANSLISSDVSLLI